jgi:hypothetical protein
MKKRFSLRRMAWVFGMACWSGPDGGLTPAPAAVIAQTFARPLAPNTLSWGPDVQAVVEYQQRAYPMQWRIAPLAVDLDNNGTVDLTFSGDESPFINSMGVNLTGRNEVWATIGVSVPPVDLYAVALKSGLQLGPSFVSGKPTLGWFNDEDAPGPAILMAGIQGTAYRGTFLPDVPFEQKYLGVRFEREGALHYGWVGISGYANIGQEIYIHAWAYESEPDTAIIVGQIPEPGAGLLAAASGLLLTLWRKRNQTSDKRRLE